MWKTSAGEVCYYISDTALNYTAAKTACPAGGQLFSPTSSAVLEAFQSHYGTLGKHNKTG